MTLDAPVLEANAARHRETLALKGMDCASCAASVEHVVKKLPGVSSVAVQYSVERMTVEYDAAQTSQDDIARAVSRLGYRVLPASAPQHHDHAHHDNHASWLNAHAEIALAILAGLLLLLGWIGERFGGWPTTTARFVFALSYACGGYNLVRHTVPALLKGRLDVDFLMLVAGIGAAILGDWAEGAFLLFLFAFGHALEHYAMERARNAIRALGQITPRVARVRRDGVEVEIPVEALQIGDIALVRPGDRIAVDGAILRGHSNVDQSPITGESMPVEKLVGDCIFAGSINGDGALEVEVQKLHQDTTLQRVIQMVEEAQAQKSPSQTFAESFERIFVPTVLVIVVLAALVPPLVGWLTWPVAISRALSTLVAASPCALALATPAAVLAGIAQAARNGVLIKGGAHLENLGALRAIAFDKTGTLTQGQPVVTDVIEGRGVAPSSLLAPRSSLLRLAASVESRASHPLAQAVVRRAREAGLELAEASDVQTKPGRGVVAQVEGQTVRLGNAALFDEAGLNIPDELAQAARRLGDEGKSTMFVGVDLQVCGVLALADEPRDDAPSTVEALRRAGVKTLVMLSGDNARVAGVIAARVGIEDVRAGLLPEGKLAVLRELLEQHGRVAMVGDGVNDAPALASATVGIAMGAGGTDVALEVADVALMGDDLSRLPYAVALSRQARAIIRQNLWIALGVIAILVPSTLFGFARLGVAVVFHEGSTLVVLVNALRLLSFRVKPGG